MSQASDPTLIGPEGTARIDAPAVGPAGTARIDAPQAAAQAASAGSDIGPAGTARIDAPAVGPAGTARIDTPAAGPTGTARVDAPSTTPVASPTSGAGTVGGEAVAWLHAGQSLSLNGQTYLVVTELTQHTTEARTCVAQTPDGRQVVLKHYRPGIRAKQPVLRKLRELPHRNVVTILDLGTVDGRDVEVMEYVAGGTLEQHLRHHGPIRDLALLRRLAAGIADGLDHLHGTVGLIYQDLKPANVLLSGPDFERVVLADFGISTLRAAGSPDVQVTANGTREYAAPELSRFGNQTVAFVTEKVDYFALGITLLGCWQGATPFEGVPDGRRIQQIQDKEVPFPLDIDKSLETLIKGLVHPGVKDRFGREEVRRWIDQQSLQVDYASSRRSYQRRAFLGDEYFETPAQLAALLEKYPDKGEDHLFMGSIQKWLDACEDMDLSTEMQKIVRQFDRDPASRQAGLLRAIYTLDIDRPFVSHAGRQATTEEGFAELLLAEKAHYLSALAKPNEPFYLYLQARGEQEFATETLGRFMSKDPAELSFNTVVFNLHSGGRNRLRLGGQDFFTPDELAQAPQAVRDEAAQQVTQSASLLLIWLQRLGHVEKIEGLRGAEPVDQMGLMHALPWLSFKDLVPDWADRQGGIATALLRRKREDLLPTFARLGLDFNASAGKLRPLVMAACNGMLDAIRFMLDRGARLDVIDGFGLLPLGGAVSFRRPEAIALLLSRGADLHATDEQQRTLLELALLKVNADGAKQPVVPQVVEQLLAAGADPNRPGSTGQLPLHLALQNAEAAQVPALVGKLLQAGANPALTSPNGFVANMPPMDAWAATLFASQYVHGHHADFLPVLESLVKAGARVDAVYGGKAGLHWAAAWGSEPLARALLALGASTDQVADDHMLPGTYARLKRAQALEPLLQPGPHWAGKARRWRLVTGALKTVLVMMVLLAATGTMWPALLMIRGHSNMPFGLGTWGLMVALVLAMRLGLSHPAAPAGQGLKALLRSFGGWIKLLVAWPALLGLVGVALSAGFFLQTPYSYGMQLMGLGWIAAMAAFVLAIWLIVRQRRHTRLAAPWVAYENAGATGATPGAAQAASAARGRTILIVLLGGLLSAPVLWLLRDFSIQDNARFQQAQAEKQAAQDSGRQGVLTANYTVTMPGNQSCVLPAGTRVTNRHDHDKRNGVAREAAQVPVVTGNCVGRFPPQTRIAIPSRLLRDVNSPSAK